MIDMPLFMTPMMKAPTTAPITLPVPPEADAKPEIEALRRAVTQQFDQYVKLNKKIPPEILTSIAGIDDAGRLADTIAAVGLMIAFVFKEAWSSFHHNGFAWFSGGGTGDERHAGGKAGGGKAHGDLPNGLCRGAPERHGGAFELDGRLRDAGTQADHGARQEEQDIGEQQLRLEPRRADPSVCETLGRPVQHRERGPGGHITV